LTVSEADAELGPIVPVITGFVGAATPEVLIVNIAVVDPAGTKTWGGVDADGSELDRVTSTPCPEAAGEIVTVPVTGLPPTTAVGEIDKPVTLVLTVPRA